MHSLHGVLFHLNKKNCSYRLMLGVEQIFLQTIWPNPLTGQKTTKTHSVVLFYHKQLFNYLFCCSIHFDFISEDIWTGKTGKQLSSETFPKSSSGNVKSAFIMLSNSSGMFSLWKTGTFQSLDERQSNFMCIKKTEVNRTHISKIRAPMDQLLHFTSRASPVKISGATYFSFLLVGCQKVINAPHVMDVCFLH